MSMHIYETIANFSLSLDVVLPSTDSVVLFHGFHKQAASNIPAHDEPCGP